MEGEANSIQQCVNVITQVSFLLGWFWWQRNSGHPDHDGHGICCPEVGTSGEGHARPQRGHLDDGTSESVFRKIQSRIHQRRNRQSR